MAGLFETADALIDSFSTAYDSGRYAGNAVADRVNRVKSIFKGESANQGGSNAVQYYEDPTPQAVTTLSAGVNTNKVIIIGVIVLFVMASMKG